MWAIWEIFGVGNGKENCQNSEFGSKLQTCGAKNPTKTSKHRRCPKVRNA